MDEITDYKTAFECFKKRFLEKKMSIFRLDSEDIILDSESVGYLVDNYIKRGLGGNASFIDKIRYQLVDAPEKNNTDETVVKNAIEILAHCVWLWRLVPENAKTISTIKGVKEILALNSELENIQLADNPFLNDSVKGIAITGTYYNTNKPIEIAFVIEFLKEYLTTEDDRNEISILNNVGDVSITTIGEYDEEKKIIESKNPKNNESKPASIFNALLYFFDSENYEAIISNGHKQSIVETFKHLIVDCDGDNTLLPVINMNLKCIKEKLKGNYGDYKGIHFFYQSKIQKLWKKIDLDIYKNIIYHGAPGTGKTYELKKEIAEYIEIYDGGKSEFIQFHSSYYYEDFIGGLKPDVQSKNGLSLKFTNGIFKELCKKASRYEIAYYKAAKSKENELPQILDEKAVLKKALTIQLDEIETFLIEKNIPILSQFPPYFILIDEINRADLSKVFGELLFAIEDDYRGFEHKFKLSTSQMENEETAVYWDAENSEALFFVPKNIYIRGTMNDIDRSVDSIDFAFRRRFKWVEKKYEEDKIIEILEDKDIEITDLRKFIKSCNKLNKKILAISIADESYQIGHAIFSNISKYLKSKTVTKESKEKLFDYHIEPIIYNYLKMDYGNEGDDIKKFRDEFVK